MAAFRYCNSANRASVLCFGGPPAARRRRWPAARTLRAPGPTTGMGSRRESHGAEKVTGELELNNEGGLVDVGSIAFGKIYFSVQGFTRFIETLLPIV